MYWNAGIFQLVLLCQFWMEHGPNPMYRFGDGEVPICRLELINRWIDHQRWLPCPSHFLVCRETHCGTHGLLAVPIYLVRFSTSWKDFSLHLNASNRSRVLIQCYRQTQRGKASCMLLYDHIDDQGFIQPLGRWSKWLYHQILLDREDRDHQMRGCHLKIKRIIRIDNYSNVLPPVAPPYTTT